MSKYLKTLKNLLDNRESIHYSKWMKIVENADRETLSYLNNEGFETIKYFTRDDWMDSDAQDDIKSLALKRIHQIDTDHWFEERFGD